MNGTWSEVVIAGKKADVFQPADLPHPRFGVLFLHPYALKTLSDDEVFTRLLDELRLPCVSPHALHTWWADRVCREFDEHLTAERHVLDNVLPYFKERWQLTPRRIGLFGISMGGQGALRLAFKHAELFPVVAGISSALDLQEIYGAGTPLDEMYPSREHCRQDTAILHVPPVNAPPSIYFCCDPQDEKWYRGNDRLHEKLSALGIEHTADLTTEAGGHTRQYFDHMAEPVMRFILAGLERESRRLL